MIPRGHLAHMFFTKEDFLSLWEALKWSVAGMAINELHLDSAHFIWQLHWTTRTPQTANVFVEVWGRSSLHCVHDLAVVGDSVVLCQEVISNLNKSHEMSKVPLDMMFGQVLKTFSGNCSMVEEINRGLWNRISNSSEEATDNADQEARMARYTSRIDS